MAEEDKVQDQKQDQENVESQQQSQKEIEVKEMSADEFKKQVDSELKITEEEYKKKAEEMGYLPFLKVEVGENRLEFLKVAPKKHATFTERMVFTVLKDGQKYAFGVNRFGKLYREILKNLGDGKFKMKVVRTGTTKTDTRYDIQAVE